MSPRAPRVGGTRAVGRRLASSRRSPCQNQLPLTALSPDTVAPAARHAPTTAPVLPARRVLPPTVGRRLPAHPAAPSRGEALRDSLAALLGSRALVWMAGVGTILLFGFGPARGVFDPRALTSGFGYVGNLLAAPAARWDGAWYLTIAHYGYLPQLGRFTVSRAAFFPLYPLLVAVVSAAGLAGALAGVIVSLLGLLAALYGLHRLVALELAEERLRVSWRSGRWEGAGRRERGAGGGVLRLQRGEPAVSDARRVARLAVVLIAVAPMALFLSADYSESLYLALSIGVFLSARRGRWLWVGVLGGLAAATRSTGVVLLAPALVLYLYGPRADMRMAAARAGAPSAGRRLGRLRAALRPRFALRRDVLWLALIPLGLLAFMGYLWLAGGEALAPLHAQALWGRHFAGPFVAAFDGAKAACEGARQLLSGQSSHLYFPLEGNSPSIEAGRNIMLFAFLALAVPASIGVLRRLPLAYGVYVLAALALPLSYPVATQPLMSLPRFLLVLFPLFIWLAACLASRPAARALVLAVSLALLVFFTGQFSTWHWVA